MAYIEALLARIRGILAGRNDVVEKRMFGGVAFMVRGGMACGPQGDALIVRIGEEAAAKHIEQPHVEPMDFTSRVTKAFATIEPEGIKTGEQLRKWGLPAADFAVTDQDNTTAKSKKPRKRGSANSSRGQVERRVDGQNDGLQTDYWNQGA